MNRKNWIKQQLKDGKTLHGLWSQSASPTIVEAAVYAGWSVILIDNEHGYTSLETTLHMIRAVESAGGHVIVRVPWNDQVYLKRILDIGVQSIMVPMILDQASAEAAVAACRYPPRGQRGYAAPLVRASGFGTNPEYGGQASDELLLIAQIEHADAVKNIPQIATIDGIDMLFIGPYDLSGSMGILGELESDEVRGAVAGIEQDVRASGKMLGCLPLPGFTNAELRERGHQLITGHSDITIFVRGASKALKDE